jgi:hypothetical protein
MGASFAIQLVPQDHGQMSVKLDHFRLRCAAGQELAEKIQPQMNSDQKPMNYPR